MPRPTASRGPTGTTERALAPDLARGFMLLFIALANTVWYLWALPSGGATMHPPSEDLPDRIAQFFTIVVVDMRSYPMFAFLFGYGMVQLARRQEAAGSDAKAVAALLRRRNLWLIAFGAVHALLLWMGDVLGAYGVAGLLLGWLFLRRRETTLLVWGWVLTGLLASLSVLGLLSMPFLGSLPDEDAAGMEALAGSIADPSFLTAALDRITVWPGVALLQGVFGLAIPAAILFGYRAARMRVLEEPGAHLPLLRRTAVIGISVGWLGGLPLALYQVGALDLNATQAQILTLPHMTTGILCGVGYVALIALIAHRIQNRDREPGVVVTALSATGRRSLSAYLGQSVLCAPILSAWGLGLAAWMTSWTMFLYAVGVWLVTVVIAYGMERAGRRGPAEVLLRRLSYRRVNTPSPASAPEGDEGPHQERTTP